MPVSELQQALLQYKQAWQNFEQADYNWIYPAVYDLISAEQSVDVLIREGRRLVEH